VIALQILNSVSEELDGQRAADVMQSADMATNTSRISRVIAPAAQVGRVPSMRILLEREQEHRFRSLMERLVMIDLHQHVMALPADPDDISDYFRGTDYHWGYEAARVGGFSGVCTANMLSTLKSQSEAAFAGSSFAKFSDLIDEIGLMFAGMERHRDVVVRASSADDIVAAKATGKLALLPTVEHLALGNDLHRVNVLFGIGVRLAGLTYSRQNSLGSGQYERVDGGVTDLGIEVIRRMNELGMVIDLSHSGPQTALDTIAFSKAPVVFSHNASYTLRPTKRSRRDEELRACAEKGGVIGVTAVPNALSDDPKQDINCVLDQYDHLIKLLGIQHVAIGTDISVGDGVGFQRHFGGSLHQEGPVAAGAAATRALGAPYLDGLESPADGSNIVRGLIARGYTDEQITAVAGGNVLRVLRQATG
jgi:membrane dipeptidase